MALNELFDNGKRLFNEEKYKEAIDYFTQSIELNHYDIESYYFRGYSYRKVKEYTKVIADSNKVIELNPNFAGAYNNRGIAERRLQKYEDAITDLTKAIKLGFKNTETFINRGIAFRKIKEYEKAIADFNEAIELDKENADAYKNLGITCRKCKKPKQAIGYHNKSIQLFPNDTDLHNEKGITLAYFNRHKTAINAFAKAISLDKDNVEAYNNIGFSYLMIKDYANAESNFRIAITRNTKYASAYINLGIVLKLKYQYFEAIKQFIEALKYNPSSYYAFATCIETYQDIKKQGNKFITKIAKNISDALVNNGKQIFDILAVYDLDIVKEIVLFMLENNQHDYFNQCVTKEIDKNKYEKYKEIYFQSLKIVSLLVVLSDEKRNGVSHYTQKQVAESLLFRKESCKYRSKFRLNTIATANDIAEGNVLFSYIGINDAVSSKNEYQSFLGCFTFNPECLNQFRLYGKIDRKEAIGVSLVFKKEFFSKFIERNLVHCAKDQSEKHNKDERYPLFRCVYIDPETKQIITLGQKEYYTFFRDNKNSTPSDIIKIENLYGKYKNKIDKKLKLIRNEFNSLRELINNNSIDKDVVANLLIYLRYLVKHVAFKEEMECRIISIEKLSENEDLKVTDNGMYIETSDVSPIIDRVYFAPHTTGFTLFKDKVEHENLTMKCIKTNLPLAIN